MINPHTAKTCTRIGFLSMFLALWVGFLSGCATPSSSPITSVSYSSTIKNNLWLPPDDEIETSLASARSILAGFDDLDTHADYHFNDQILLAVELQHSGSRDLWFVKIRVTDIRTAISDKKATLSFNDGSAKPIDPSTISIEPDQLIGTIRSEDGTQMEIRSDLMGVEVSVYDQSAELLQSSSMLIPSDFFSIGPYESCKAYGILFQNAPPPFRDDMVSALRALPEDERKEFMSSSGAGAISMGYFVQSVQSNKALMQLRSSAWMEIARVPSLLNIFSHLGLRLNVEPNFDQSRSAGYLWPDHHQPLSAFVFPTTVRANKREALRCRIVAVKPIGLLRIIAGMVYFEAVHPDKPENRVTVRLLAARNSSEGS